MFDDIPARVWLLIAITAAAYAPARYVYQYHTHAPTRREITSPPENLDWRTRDQLFRNLIILVALVGLAIFILTPAAEAFARSPTFLPVLMLGVSSFAFFTVANGLMKGQIEPLIRGLSSTYDRTAQPKRFWASLGWNACLGALGIWLMVVIIADERGKRCLDDEVTLEPQERLSACHELLAESKISDVERAELLATRGRIHYQLGALQNALADYDQAIALDPKDSYSLYNRGLVYERLGDRGSAIVAYSDALELRPDDADAYVNRGLIYLDRSRYDEAVADFTRAHELRPDDPWAIANRGITFAWKKDSARAKQDFAKVRALDPTNPVMLRGEALLSLDAGDFDGTITRSTTALRFTPDDVWSLGIRAEAYRRTGQEEKARADFDERRRLIEANNAVRVREREG